jgi:hypothetical protein
MFSDSLGCWRRVAVRKRKTTIDWAHEVKILLEEDYPDGEMVILVCDNFDTHKIGALYKRFPAERTHGYARRLKNYENW